MTYENSWDEQTYVMAAISDADWMRLTATTESLWDSLGDDEPSAAE